MYYGTYRILNDLQELQFAGRRIPGGPSTRIQFAGGYCTLLNNELRALAERNPAKLRDILEYFKLSSELHIKRKMDELEGVLRRVEEEREERSP